MENEAVRSVAVSSIAWLDGLVECTILKLKIDLSDLCRKISWRVGSFQYVTGVGLHAELTMVEIPDLKEVR